MCKLDEKRFHDDTAAREYLEATLWPDGPVCPHCGSINNAYTTSKPGKYRCAAKECRSDFTVTVGTVFERSKIPLHKWLLASFLLCASKKGMSSHQLHRVLGVTYKTAWFMTHRIREAMTTKHTGLLGSGGGTVEADETYWGNNAPYGQGNANAPRKMKVLSLVERNGGVRSFQIPNVTAKTLKPILQAHIAKDARLMTDELRSYTLVGREFASHDTVMHSRGEYARGDAYTNTVEGYFSILKRGLIGTFHHVGEQHLQRYVNEFDFRYNHRASLGISDAERTTAAIKGIKGKRLTYRRLDAQA
ncbi:MAG: IS1595 family transposase [Burkholderiales bacterium]|nr:IS1595 family transposase [Burkholderiales bacterium]